MVEKEYFIGLDLGTSSIGWAVTDSNYQLMRAKGKDLWGVRLFDEANTAAERRVNRVSRRRREREVARIGMLKSYFADEIQKVDSGFYQRLEESRYTVADKRSDSKYALFNDKAYTDKKYFSKYPTVFHLRMELINNPEKHDVRLVYLALLNMFKHRGHFLNDNLQVEVNDIEEIPELPNKNFIEKTLGRKDISRSKKAEIIAAEFRVSKKDDKKRYEMIKAICGLAFSPVALFDLSDVEDEFKKFQISFRDSSYDEKFGELENNLSDDDLVIIGSLKNVHDAGLLANVMRGCQYLSEARIEDYNKHKSDLKVLKSVLLTYIPSEYDGMFREMDKGSYSAYVNSVNSENKNRRGVKERSQEELYKRIKVILKSVPECEEKEYILSEIENESFLPKQLTSANGVIPNQVHLAEMKKILENAERYLDFLNEKDESGLTVSQRIVELFKFQIPYYVGPLNLNHKDTKEGHAWAVRKKSGKVFPWNLNEMIDTKATAEKFIERMVRHCTYLQGNAALPKESLIYERFRVLNELNNLKINGEKISVELKQKIYTELFEKGKKVTQKQLYRFLEGYGVIKAGENEVVSGIDGDFKSYLSSYGKFKSVFGEDIKKDSIKMMVEKIIYWSTIYGNDKSFVRDRIEEIYGDIIGKEQIKRIVGFKFKDWGNLSREFLELEGCSKVTGEAVSLISAMWECEGNPNLMELLSSNYTYMDNLNNIVNKHEKVLSEIEYDDLKDMYISAPVRRMVWQAILILRELESVLGCEPKRIFIEMAREDGEKGKRTESRKQRLKELYKNCKIDGRQWGKEIENLSEQELRSKKLYLYYTQMGRCMYSGEPIDIEDLFNDNLYDIDHIYPRHFVKDDSIENNLVLVKKQSNARKSDTYPIDADIRKKQIGWWKSLLTSDMQSKFITREKFNRLVNSTPFTDEQLAGFINRQLVETRQGTKVVAHIFEELMPDVEIVYVRAGNVSKFRQDREMLKSRIVNDFHHAQDAYLNIVVGNTYYVRFTTNPLNFIREYRKSPQNNQYHMYRLFDFKVERNGEVAWISGGKDGDAGTIKIVRKMMKKNSPLITRMTYERHGALYDATLYSAKENKENVYIPFKTSDERLKDVKKYGGFNNVTGTYFFLVEHEVKGKRVRTIEAMPLHLCSKLSKSTEQLRKYCEETLGMVKPDIRMKRIKIQAMIKRNGVYLNLTGRSENRLLVRNAMPLCLEQKWINYIKLLEKSLLITQVVNDISTEKNKELYNILLEKHCKGIYAKRPNSVGEKLLCRKEKFEKLSIYEQCIVILQILQLSQLSNMGANLELLEEAKKTGGMKISNNVTNAEEFVLINQSSTGIFKSEIDLKTV